DKGEQLSLLEGHWGGVTALAMVRPGRVVSGSADRSVMVWDLDSRCNVARLEGHTRAVTSLAVADDETLASGSADNTIRLWDVKRERPLTTLRGHAASVTALAFTARGRLVSASEDGTVRVWNLTDGSCEAVLDASKPLACLAVLDNPESVVLGGRQGGCFALELNPRT
ncbi:MAG: hypothetical protein HY814_13755, partial [Candidatus Riflebacteria bacterium]|nr:hypothetical protein [Candidatus Riflebacteria bacterium]